MKKEVPQFHLFTVIKDTCSGVQANISTLKLSGHSMAFTNSRRSGLQLPLLTKVLDDTGSKVRPPENTQSWNQFGKE